MKTLCSLSHAGPAARCCTAFVGPSRASSSRRACSSRAGAQSESSSGQAGDSDSSQFSSALRKHFQPKTQRPQAPATGATGAAGSASAAGTAGAGSVVFGGGDMSEEAWREIDSKINRYPGYRTFTAIGTPSQGAFRASMVEAVESIVGPVHPENVSERPSSGGKYTSVRIGPVIVKTPEQVIEIFATMKKDSRLKWFM